MKGNFLLTVTFLLLSYCKEMTGGYETSSSLNVKVYIHWTYYSVFGVLRA